MAVTTEQLIQMMRTQRSESDAYNSNSPTSLRVRFDSELYYLKDSMFDLTPSDLTLLKSGGISYERAEKYISRLGVSKYMCDSLVSRGSDSGDVKRYCVMLSIAAFANTRTGRVRSQGYDIKFRNSDGLSNSLYIDVDGYNIFQLTENHDDANADWQVLHLSPRVIDDADDDYMLKAIFNSLKNPEKKHRWV